MKRILAVLLVLVLSLSLLASCSASDSSNLTVSIGPDPETLDPTLNSASDGGTMIIHLFEGLMTYEEDGSFGYGQAESHTVSDDGLTYTFTLREGLMWSDGTPLTANDFVYSWQRAVTPAVGSAYADLFKYISGFDAIISGEAEPSTLGVTAIDDRTLEVVLASPTPFFEALVAFPTYMPLQASTIEANGDAWAVDPATYICNGAFDIEEWIPGQHIKMKKNENYWNADAIKLENLTFALMGEDTAAYAAYNAGDILATSRIPSDEIASHADDPEYHLDPQLGTYYIQANMRGEDPELDPLLDPNVRLALSLAIDRVHIAEEVMSDTYIAAASFVGPGFPDSTGGEFNANSNYIDLNDHEGNVEKAKQLLADAGYPNGEGLPVFEYKTNPDGFHVVVAEALQSMWAEIGVQITISEEEWGTFTASRRNGEFSIARNGWVGDYNDPTTLLDLLDSSNGNNDGGYNNPEYDALIDAIQTETDPAARDALMHEAEDLLMAEGAAIPIVYYTQYYLFDETLQGAWANPKGYYFFHEAEIVA